MNRAQMKTIAEDPRVSTGIEGLDDVLGGGFPEGHLFLVEGVPGSGKTTLGLQFLMEGARLGESVLYVTLSESRDEIEKVARSHGWSLEGISVYEYAATDGNLRPEDQYSAFHPSDIEFQDTTQTILRTVDDTQPRRIVIDSLSEIRLLAGDSLRYRRQVLALKHYFTSRNCTVLLLDDRTSGRNDQQLQSIAHGVLSLEKVMREFGRTRRRLEVEKMRGSTYRQGYHDYNIETGGMVVFPRLVPAEHEGTFTDGYIESVSPGLDELWGRGIERGTSTLFLGPAGSGKSSLALSYAVAAARRGEVAAVFLFEEWTRLACKRAASLDIDPSPYVDRGLICFEQINPAELSPGEFVQHVRDTVEKRGATVVVIDSLNGLLNAMPEEQYIAMQMRELLAYLNHRGVASILVLAQAGLVGSNMTSPIDLSYLADNVLLLRYFEMHGEIRKALSVVKKRGGVHERSIRELALGKGKIEVGQSLTDFRGLLTGTPVYLGEEPMLGGARDAV
ncbi:MAG: circadian clock protein KaiC [Bryobacterales bacterium]|nr:circadian clock protein KaiC [Bryobacterales bacterium]